MSQKMLIIKRQNYLIPLLRKEGSGVVDDGGFNKGRLLRNKAGLLGNKRGLL